MVAGSPSLSSSRHARKSFAAPELHRASARKVFGRGTEVSVLLTSVDGGAIGSESDRDLLAEARRHQQPSAERARPLRTFCPSAHKHFHSNGIWLRSGRTPAGAGGPGAGA